MAARRWVQSVWDHRSVLLMLARSDFHVRYKRAVFGVAWAVVVPVVQALVLAVVFARLIGFPTTKGFGPFVLAGVLAWSYFSQTLGSASSAIVDAAGLNDKVWFPRALLPIVPCLANLGGLLVSLGVLLVVAPLLGAPLGARVVWLLPAVLLLTTFTAALSMVLSAMHVYFRDVKYLVQAALLVWFYVTPIAYPKTLLKGLAGWADLNPLSGIISLFQAAIIGPTPELNRALIVSFVAVAVLVLVAVETQRRNDRLFVDLL